MKTNKMKVFLVLVFLIATSTPFFVMISGMNATCRVQETLKASTEGSELLIGDIICYPDTGDIVGKVIPGDYYHISMYIGNGKVVEAIEDGVKITPAPFDRLSSLVVVRVATTQAVRQVVVDFALTKVGLPYDFKWLSYFGGKEVNGRSYYCSELVWAAYMNEGIDLDRNPGFNWRYGNNVAPSEIFDDPDTFEV